MDLYDNVARWGTIISALPLLLSRLRLSLAGTESLLALPAPQQPAMQEGAEQQPQPSEAQEPEAADSGLQVVLSE